MRYRADWRVPGWHLAVDDRLVKVWPQVADAVADHLGREAGWHPSQHHISVLLRGQLVIAGGADVRAGEGLPPTGEGWYVFLEARDGSEEGWPWLNEAGGRGKKVPRGA